MPDSIYDYLQQDMVCEGLLECFHGLKQLDVQIFQTLGASQQPLTVDEIADRVDRERSTAYRSVQRLLETGFIEQEQVNYENGGYYHVYHAADADDVADEMQDLLNDWYAKMGQLIAEFRETYSQSQDQVPPVQ
ncbi:MULTISPECIES: helix-turn-helix domain-containing protein [Salinibaculum]|uniref:helix-turn-helix domain-containing protein n=1 Tax=Salinibaculum TaxID=2732368 RepID=UPI0030CD6227